MKNPDVTENANLASIEEVLEFLSEVQRLPAAQRDLVHKILNSVGARNPAELTPPPSPNGARHN